MPDRYVGARPTARSAGAGGAMMRAATYSRFSTDKQSEQSTGDQVPRCREFAVQRGWHIVEGLVVEDQGISGASRHNRPRLLKLVARMDEWDVLLAFDFSRMGVRSCRAWRGRLSL